jgi:hypothetical protein
MIYVLAIVILLVILYLAIEGGGTGGQNPFE